MTVSVSQAVNRIEAWYGAAVAAVEPERAVRGSVQRDGAALIVNGRRIECTGWLVVVAIGKAAMAMARGFASVAGDLIDQGIVLTKDGHAAGSAPSRFEVFEASHPIPDARGVQATRAILDLVADLDRPDVLVALVSGGGSALLEAPRPPVTLDDLARTTDHLLRAGAPIEDLNAVRRSLSLVKAGGLLRAAAPASVVTIILSDVLGNDPRVIASGATVPGRPDLGAALSMLDRYQVWDRVPDSVLTVLASVPDDLAAGPADAGGVVIIGDNAAAVAAAATAAREDGFKIEVAREAATGEASDLGREWVGRCRSMNARHDVLLGGGEATVTVRGDGVGGRNTEFALSAALALAEGGIHDWVVASLATDGEDGPTRVAGAIVDPETVVRAAASGVDVRAALANNDSLRVFEAAGGIVRPGPTGTNVNDLYFAVRVLPSPPDRPA